MTVAVHNHNSEEGKGLSCREVLVNGELVGECLLICQSCRHTHALTDMCGHQTIETVRVGVGRLDFGRGVAYRQMVTDMCRCDLRQGTELFNPRYKLSEGAWELPDA